MIPPTESVVRSVQGDELSCFESRPTHFAAKLARRIGILMLGCLGALPLRAEDGNFYIVANDRMADGKPWRGSGDIFLNLPGLPVTTTAQTKSAPSLVLCTVSSGGNIECPGSKGRDSMGRFGSPCHLSKDCEFNDIALPAGDVFGLVVISPGMLYTNLVDAVVFSRKKISTKDPAYQDLNTILHQVVERIATSGSDDERRRRERPFPLKTFDDCAVAACTLRQSELKFEVQ
jgi:hypothetical protein